MDFGSQVVQIQVSDFEIHHAMRIDFQNTGLKTGQVAEEQLFRFRRESVLHGMKIFSRNFRHRPLCGLTGKERQVDAVVSLQFIGGQSNIFFDKSCLIVIVHDCVNAYQALCFCLDGLVVRFMTDGVSFYQPVGVFRKRRYFSVFDAVRWLWYDIALRHSVGVFSDRFLFCHRRLLSAKL